jgi:hypothetical protein
MRIVQEIGILMRIISLMVRQVFVFAFLLGVVSAGFALAFHVLLGEEVYSHRSWQWSILALIR